MRILYRLPAKEFYDGGVEGVSLFGLLFIYWRKPVQVWWRDTKLVHINAGWKP